MVLNYVQEQLKLAQHDHHKMEDSLRKELLDKQALLTQLEEDAAKKEAGVASVSLQERSQGEGMDQSELDSFSGVNSNLMCVCGIIICHLLPW